MTREERKEKALDELDDILLEHDFDVIRASMVVDVCDSDESKVIGFAIILVLGSQISNKYLDAWREHLSADDYVVYIDKCTLYVRYNVMY